MKIELQAETNPKWIRMVLDNFDHFLLDHAACERKASATGIQFVVHYPDRSKLIDPMLRLAREELLHFHQVVRLILNRNLELQSDEKDPYVNLLLKRARHGRVQNFLDRLLIFGIVEARGTERFGLVAKHVEDEELREFYKNLTKAEERHHEIFVELACGYFPEIEVSSRLNELLDDEAKIIKEIPLRPAVH